MDDGSTSFAGALQWARYAYPPNMLGYCGPVDHAALFDHGAAGVVDQGLIELLQGFEGAWPYTTFIAGQAGVNDPFDPQVVEAYWLGGPLLNRVSTTAFGEHLMTRFRNRLGVMEWDYLAEAIPLGARPTHAYHVFGVYPWVGRLRGDHEGTALEVLDRCRIRWGRVLRVDGDTVTVESRRLQWDGMRLSVGTAITEEAMLGHGGTVLLDDLRAGEHVALHWHWVCDRLSPRQLAMLRRSTAEQLRITNDQVAHPGGMTLATAEREF